VVCPSCHEKIYLRKLRLPSPEEIEQYLSKVGQEYRRHQY
jgi:hypothetical protein